MIVFAGQSAIVNPALTIRHRQGQASPLRVVLSNVPRSFVMRIVPLSRAVLPCGSIGLMNRRHFLSLATPALLAQAPNPAYAPVTDVPNLPRVLLIGDSISIGYTVPVRNQLARRANVHRPGENCRHSGVGLEKLDAWLGGGKWDAIHYNFGLHDCVIMPTGLHQVPLAQYESNMTRIAARLKQTGARVVWTATTPVPPGTGSRNQGDEIAYNRAAQRIASDAGFAIDDLFSFALPQLARIQLPANVHFTKEGSEILGAEVVRHLTRALGIS